MHPPANDTGVVLWVPRVKPLITRLRHRRARQGASRSYGFAERCRAFVAGDLRFDAVQVLGTPAWSALIALLARAWPPEAMTAAVAELWTGWDAVRSYWAGHAGDALGAGRLAGDVLGLWWG